MNISRRFSSLTPGQWMRAGLGAAALVGIAALVMPLRAAIGDFDIAQEPLYTKQSQPPLMMMVMSRDEQLFNKAYSDYSDVNEDGIIDTTYLDTFTYGGYFDSKLCYTFVLDVFKATSVAAGTNGHSCSNQWSGNFLNWITMSRLDLMRSVMYGGLRSEDGAGLLGLGRTVLERAQIPNDLHAWVKVYSGSDIHNFAPLRGTHSFCNATVQANGAPLMRVASGNWSEWASTASYQCGLNRSGEGSADTPRTLALNLPVRVDVCSGTANLRESFCRKYNDGLVDRWKPAGVLQNYGENGRIRFGLISGSYVNPRDGGTVRRNIGKLAGNGTGNCAAGDEINLSTGQFCNLTNSGTEGIINTMSSFRIDQWNWSNNWNDCNQYGILNRQDQGGNGNLSDPGNASQKCSAWGNPLAEMYAEALRYVTAGTGQYADASDLSGMPKGVKWADPYRSPSSGGNSYCATCNILVLSSGLPSFDSDNLGTIPALINADTQTDAIGTSEGIVGKDWMAGRIGKTPRYTSLNTHEDICRGATVSRLSDVRGICPDIPSMEGSFLLAGLARGAATTDLRPTLTGKPSGYKLTATTYTVAMAENLPTFQIKVGNRSIGLSPLCQANNSEGANQASGGWRSCFLGSVGIGTKQANNTGGNLVYGRPYRDDAQAGSFSLVWEDSLWGNDHDNDVVAMMSYCVGKACEDTGDFNNICWRADSRASVSYSAANGSAVCTGDRNNVGTGINGKVADDEVLVRIENLSAYAGNAMLTGYTISGSNAADTVQRLALRRGNANGSVLSTVNNYPNNWQRPVVMKYKASANAAAGQLQSPLWYAAKYGVPAGKAWDSKVKGVPDNYFLARNPTKLRSALEEIFDSVAEGDAPVGGSGSGARITTGSFTVASSYNIPSGTYDWTGDVRAMEVLPGGGDGKELWRASTKIAGSTRRIYMATAPTATDSKGVVTAVKAAEFTAGNLPGTGDRAKLTALGFVDSVPNWANGVSPASMVSYLRGTAVSGLRTRSSPLGDIVNSTTEIVNKRDDYGYASWQLSDTEWKKTLGKSYANFLNAKRADAGPPTMVYVGANDGMLHGFNASTTAAAGSEEMAFIPSAALQHIAELGNPKYGHRYYVDGPVTSSDVYYGSAWHTVLVGTTGAGGATKTANAPIGNGSVFGLNIGNPTGFKASDVLWEVSGRTESDLGFVLGKPVIVPVAGGTGNVAPRFVALFGNGINSTSGKPVLFAVDIQTGKVLSRLTPSDTKYAGRNGLLNIAPVALANNNGITDTVYAGDMKGNLWKFDLSNGDPSKWSVGLGGTPLFTAVRNNVAQPITGAIEVSSGPGGGVSLFFGTGQYFAADDNTVTNASPVQSIYGVWDNLKTTAGTRSDLVGQTISEIDGGELRRVSRNAVNYVTRRGWYVDLIIGTAVQGERFIGTPNIQNGSVFFTTYIPGAAVCGTGGGENWLYGLNLLTGGGSMSGLSRTPGGDPMCTGDCGAARLSAGDSGAVGGPVKDNSIFVPKPVKCDATQEECTIDELLTPCSFVLRAPGADPLYMPRPCGRQSWRQIR